MKPLVLAEGVGLRFHKRSASLRNRFMQGLRPIKKDFWALRNLSFAVNQGEILGVIGPNGAGKTTLLRLLAGVYAPDEGELRVTGRVGSMLSLGSGFMVNLSGRHNIVLQGLLQGLTIETIRKREEEIIHFSGLEEFIDDPVSTYSSGMRARLGFALSLAIEADILLIDEVLGVGDRDFVKKSRAAMLQMIRSGKTVVLVSHNLKTISDLSTRVVWLDRGQEVKQGDPRSVLAAFRQPPVLAVEG